MTERARLRKAIHRLHGLESTHLRSEPVHETLRRDTAWEGIVEVFTVYGHAKTRLAYAWSHETDDGKRKYVAVLAVEPINTPLDAVRASIAAEARKAP